MSEACAEELRLIEAVDAVKLLSENLNEVMQLLNGWLQEVMWVFANGRLQRPQSLRPTHALMREINKIDALLITSAEGWTRHWKLLDPAKLLAESLKDRIMLLVFGKFNAGKSSLCNLLAERFATHHRAVQYFHLKAGRIVPTLQPFGEGATETTAYLQGVFLGDGVVLLDTPGLHSLTYDNAALTHQFIESADAVMWLTSSTSPGQVQELDKLARELHRGKPLLPVITRSDVIEEEEVDGQIVKLLRNKTGSNRLLQEDDVQTRTRDKLLQIGVDPTVVRAPISVSAHVARAQGQTTQALQDGGVTRLYAAVLDLIEPARAYKRRKPAEVLLHHLEENVLGAVESHIQPALSNLAVHLLQERERLHKLKPQLTGVVWRQVASELPRLLEQHAAPHNMAVLCREFENVMIEAMTREVALRLSDYAFRTPEVRAVLKMHSALELDDEKIFGTSTPVVSGTAMPNMQGTSITDHYERLHEILQRSMLQQLETQLGTIFLQCGQALDEIERSVCLMQKSMSAHTEALLQIKRKLRDGDATN